MQLFNGDRRIVHCFLRFFFRKTFPLSTGAGAVSEEIDLYEAAGTGRKRQEIERTRHDKMTK